MVLFTQVKQALHHGYDDDVNPPLSALAQYIKDELTHEGYKHMMAVGEHCPDTNGLRAIIQRLSDQWLGKCLPLSRCTCQYHEQWSLRYCLVQNQLGMPCIGLSEIKRFCNFLRRESRRVYLYTYKHEGIYIMQKMQSSSCCSRPTRVNT